MLTLSRTSIVSQQFCFQKARWFSTGKDPKDKVNEEAAMVQAMQFMNAVKDFSFIEEIKDMNEWRTKVMEELDKPIILDCYADWCQPCKKLTPVLEKLT